MISRKKRVKAWAVVLKHPEYPLTMTPTKEHSCWAIYEKKWVAMNMRSNKAEIVVPCTITYEIPKKKRGVK